MKLAEAMTAPSLRRRRERITISALVRLVIGIVVLVGVASSATAQVKIKGKISLKGLVNLPSQSGLHQNTHIWAFAPPDNTGGVGANDNVNFVNNVMPSIDGVSILEAWNVIETSPPDSNACAPSDLCQPDPVVPQMYHHYDWTSTSQSYDSIAMTGSPVYQWLKLSGKKVNLLIAAEASGTINPITPHYVTSPAWYNLFSTQQQDVMNAVKDCTDLPWTGTTGANVTASGSAGTVTVTDSNGCCNPPGGTPSQNSLVQDQDKVWVTTTTAGCGTGINGATATVATGSNNSFTYTAAGCNSALSSPAYLDAAQSWAVPYEAPYKAALKAYWAAVVAHYQPGFSLNGNPYFSKLNYFRFGGSVGSEWYPYCVSGTNSSSGNAGLDYLTNGYAFGTGTIWLDYYKEMGDYLESLAPPFQIIHSINAVDTSPGVHDYSFPTTEAGYAVGWSNRFGWRDGIGSQGLSAKDKINCTSPNSCTSCTTGGLCSASNWYPMFLLYGPPLGVPLELQPIALSNYNDPTCSPACTPNTDSGDLRVFLPFATSPGSTTDFEIYWRDLSLAYDNQDYCILGVTACQPGSATTGGQIMSTTVQQTYFQNVGQGKPTMSHPDCTGSYQTGATGDCTYETDISQAHGQH